MGDTSLGAAGNPGRASLGLGDLETAIVEVLWEASVALTVREVRAVLAPRRPLAYTTVQTVLDKLHRKGWAERLRSGRAFAYRATSSREETAARVLYSLLYAAGDMDTALLHFVGFVSSREQDVLRAALTDGGPPTPARGDTES